MPAPVPSLDQSRPRTLPAVMAAMILAPLGALVCGLIVFGLAMGRLDEPPLRVLFNAPVASPLPFRPVMLVATLVGLVVLVAVVWLVVLLVARSADRRRGFAAVLFGTWLALILGGWLAALASAPVMFVAMRLPGELAGQQLLQRISAGGGWGLYWGWLTGLVSALIFKSTNRAT